MLVNGARIRHPHEMKELPMSEKFGVVVYYGTEGRELGSLIGSPRYSMKVPVRAVYAFSVRNVNIFNTFVKDYQFSGVIWRQWLDDNATVFVVTGDDELDTTFSVQPIQFFNNLLESSIPFRTVRYDIRGENPFPNLVPGTEYIVRVATPLRFGLASLSTPTELILDAFKPAPGVTFSNARFGNVIKFSLPKGHYAYEPRVVKETKLTGGDDMPLTNDIISTLEEAGYYGLPEHDTDVFSNPRSIRLALMNNTRITPVAGATSMFNVFTTNRATDRITYDLRMDDYLTGVVFSEPGNTSHTFELTPDITVSTSLLRALSLSNSNATYNETKSLAAGQPIFEWKSDGGVNLSGPPRVFISSDVVSNTQLLSNVGENSWCITVPITSNPDSNNYYEPSERTYVQLRGTTDITKISFALRGHEGELLDTNDTDWSIEVEFFASDLVC